MPQAYAMTQHHRQLLKRATVIAQHLDVTWYELNDVHYVVFQDFIVEGNCQTALKWYNKLSGQSLKWTEV